MQVVEADERPQLERGVDAAADGQADDGVGAGLRERGEVGAMRDVVGEPDVAFAVARDVQHVGAGEAAARDRSPRPTRSRTRSGVASNPGSR